MGFSLSDKKENYMIPYLDVPLSDDTYQRYYDGLQPEPVTTFGGQGRRSRVYVTGGPSYRKPEPSVYDSPAYQLGRDTQLMPDTEQPIQLLPLRDDTPPDRPYGSPFDYMLSKPQPTPVPVLAYTPLTDKTPADVPLDATIYNNPATEGLLTVTMPGSPLINNLQDRPGMLTAADPIPGAVALDPAATEEPTQDTTETDNVDIAPGVHIKKSVLKETGIFLVGALILVIGVFALTR